MMNGILIENGSSAERAIEEQSRINAENMAKDGVEKIADIYWRKFKINKFWVLFYGKRDMITDKINVAMRMYTEKTRPRRKMMGCQMWYFDMGAGVKELEWILPLEDKDKNKSYTGGNRLIHQSLVEEEKLLGLSLTDRPRT